MADYLLLHDDGGSADLLEERIDAEDDEEARELARIRLSTAPKIRQIVVLKRAVEMGSFGANSERTRLVIAWTRSWRPVR